MSELAKRMMQRHIKSEDGAAAASGSAGAASGASVTGNAGLSALGQVPSGTLGVIGSKAKKNRRECKSCGYVTAHEEVKICYECGDRLPKLDERSMEERLADFRTEQIHLSQGKNGFGWIDDAVSQIMNVMTTGHPEVIHESDDISTAAFRERVTNMLHGFECWRQRREQGITF